MKTVVLDTDIIIGKLFGSEPIATAFDSVLKSHSLSFTEDTLKELQNTLYLPTFDRHAPYEQRCQLFNEIKEKGKIFAAERTVNTIKIDPSDNIILSAAVASKADFILTNNYKHIGILGSFEGIPIYTPQQCLELQHQGITPGRHALSAKLERIELAQKMQLLVDRGYQVDFKEVRNLCRTSLTTVEECWSVWSEHNPNLRQSDAKIQVGKHLAAIERERPLSSIDDPAVRDSVFANRDWFKQNFIRQNLKINHELGL